MKTIRLLYPDYLGGGLDEYYFGANLLAHILPFNKKQPLLKVDIIPPDGQKRKIVSGIYAKDEIINGINRATEIIKIAKPDRIITIGGSCIVSMPSFDYLHGIYNNIGIVWIDAHPDISCTENYHNAHAMVLRSLMGYGNNSFSEFMKNKPFAVEDVLYVGLQKLHTYQEKFLNDIGVDYKIQTDEFISNDKIKQFINHFKYLLIHLDIDVLDPNFFHSTYFANKDLVGDGSGSGRMTIEKLSTILNYITENKEVVGFTISEYLPFDEYKLHNMFKNINLFNI